MHAVARLNRPPPAKLTTNLCTLFACLAPASKGSVAWSGPVVLLVLPWQHWPQTTWVGRIKRRPVDPALRQAVRFTFIVCRSVLLDGIGCLSHLPESNIERYPATEHRQIDHI